MESPLKSVLMLRIRNRSENESPSKHNNSHFGNTQERKSFNELNLPVDTSKRSNLRANFDDSKNDFIPPVNFFKPRVLENLNLQSSKAPR